MKDLELEATYLLVYLGCSCVCCHHSYKLSFLLLLRFKGCFESWVQGTYGLSIQTRKGSPPLTFQKTVNLKIDVFFSPPTPAIYSSCMYQERGKQANFHQFLFLG